MAKWGKMKKIFLLMLFLIVSTPVCAELSIDITGAHSAPMATGLPVFLCDPNLREVLPEGSYVLAAGPEPEAMAAALEALPAGQIEKMSRVMMAHREEALQSAQIQKLLAVYQEALAG